MMVITSTDINTHVEPMTESQKTFDKGLNLGDFRQFSLMGESTRESQNFVTTAFTVFLESGEISHFILNFSDTYLPHPL